MPGGGEEPWRMLVKGEAANSWLGLSKGLYWLEQSKPTVCNILVAADGLDNCLDNIQLFRQPVGLNQLA